MVHLAMTSSMASAIQALGTAGVEVPNEEPSLDDPAPGKPISHLQVIRLASLARKCAMNEYTLEKLLRGADLYTPHPPPKPEPSTEYRVLMERLRRDQEEQAYRDMLSSRGNISDAHMVNRDTQPNLKPTSDDNISYSDVNRQIALIVNLLFSVLGVGAAIWLVTRWWTPTTRIFVALGGSVAVGVAEIILYMMFEGKKEKAEAKESDKKEKKEVVRKWVVKPSEGDAGNKFEEIAGDGKGPPSLKPEDGLRKRIYRSDE